MICEKCGKEFFEKGKYSSGRFCSRSCANGKKWSEKDKQKKRDAFFKSEKCLNDLKRRRDIAKNNIISKICPICNKSFKVNKKYQTIYCSNFCKNQDKDYKFRKKPNSGGYRKGSGRSKYGYYKNIWCDTTYELAFVIYCLDHNIKVERFKDYFVYYFQNKYHKYFPDFIIGDIIFEIKGYKNEAFYEKSNLLMIVVK